MKKNQCRDKDGESKYKMEKIDQDYREGEDFAGEVDFLYKVAVFGDGDRAHGEGRVEEGPGHEGGEEEDREVFHFEFHDVFEGDCIDGEHEEWIEEGPEETEGRPFVFDFEVSEHEVIDKVLKFPYTFYFFNHS